MRSDESFRPPLHDTVPWQEHTTSRKSTAAGVAAAVASLSLLLLSTRLRKIIFARLLCCNAFPIRTPPDGLPITTCIRSTCTIRLSIFAGKLIPARVYLPRGVGFAPGIVVVHGMHELGIDEPRLVSFARSLAASGFFVMTPLVPGIADYRVQAESADVIGSAARDFAQQLEVPKVGIFAISFSGGLALLAASDPQYAPSVAWVASIGGYYDLAHVLRFFATGDAVRPDGTVEHLQPHEYGPLIVIYDEPQDFFSAHDAPLAHDALKLLLHDHGKASEEVTQKMTPAGQQIMQEIYQKHRESLTPAILAEIDKRSDELAAASPAGHLRFLQAPVLLLHGSDDSDHSADRAALAQARHSRRTNLVDALETSGHRPRRGRTARSRCSERLALVHWMAMMIHTARRHRPGPTTRGHMDPVCRSVDRKAVHKRRITTGDSHGDTLRYPAGPATIARHRRSHSAYPVLSSGGRLMSRHRAGSSG